MKRLLLVALLAVLGRPAAAGHPLGLDENHPYGRLGTAYVTPHVAWANPYARGKIRALVIAPAWSQRETVELAQRLSLDFTPWMSATFSAFTTRAEFDPAFSFFQAPPEVVQRAGAEALKKEYDVLIVGKVDWAAIPGRQRFQLLEKVAGGMGLLYVNPPAGNKELDLVFGRHPAPAEAARITAGVPLAALPRLAGVPSDRLVRPARFGKGRVVVLDYQEPPPSDKNAYESCAWPCLTPQWDLTDTKEGFQPVDALPEAEFVPYEYYQALVARTVLWAADKEPQTHLSAGDLPERVPWPAAGRAAILGVDKAPASCTLRAVVRSRTTGAALPLGTKPAGAAVRFPLPHLPAGDYFLDAWAQAGGATLDWASRVFTVTADSPLGAITLDRPQYNPGDAMAGRIAFTRPVAAGEKVVASLWDNLGRQVGSAPVQPSGAFRFGPLRPLTALHRVEVSLLRGGKTVCRAGHTFPVRARRGWEEFNEIVWSGGENNFLTHLMLRRLAREDQATAIDIGWRGNTNARNLALADLAAVPYTARYGCFGPAKDNVTPEHPDNAYGCMSGPVTLANLDKWGDTQSSIYGPYGPLAWTHGDETNYGYDAPDICWSKTCLAAFRQYARAAYADLNAANREWGTSFATWEEVLPLTFAEAKRTRAYARWIDHRHSSNRVFAGFYRHSGEALSRHDPGARAGFDGGVGLDRPNSGGDWWTLSRETDILHSYIGDSAQMEVYRSFARPEQVRGMWYGTYGLTWQIGPNTVPYCHLFPWYSLFHGMNTTWFWTMGAPGPLSGYAPDFTPLPFFRARTESLRQIRGGLGRLLLSGTRDDDGIALHCSETSRIAESFFAAKEADWSSGYTRALAGFNKALEDSGFQYRYLATEQIAGGALAKDGCKVLILPHSRAISDGEADAIRRFVRAGGVAVADVLPGVLNGHGTPRPASVLADLFPSDTSDSVTTVGKGKSVLIGDLLAGYARAHQDQFGWKRLPLERSRKLAELLRRHAGLVPAVAIAPAKAEPMPPTEVTRFRCGAVELVGLLRQPFLYDNDAYAARIRFPRRAHLYDVMAGKYLGSTDRVAAEVSYRAMLYALSPYQVAGVAVDAPAAARAGTPTPVTVAVRPAGAARASRHVFRLEVLGPDGRPLSHYAQNLAAEAGTVRASVPWALNDRPGTYTLTARDAMSGVAGRRVVTLR